MELPEDEFTKQLMGSTMANGIFLLVFLVVKCCKERLKHSHCKSGCCEFDADMATIRRKDSSSSDSTNSVSKKINKHHAEV